MEFPRALASEFCLYTIILYAYLYFTLCALSLQYTGISRATHEYNDKSVAIVSVFVCILFTTLTQVKNEAVLGDEEIVDFPYPHGIFMLYHATLKTRAYKYMHTHTQTENTELKHVHDSH